MKAKGSKVKDWKGIVRFWLFLGTSLAKPGTECAELQHGKKKSEERRFLYCTLHLASGH